MQPNTTAEQAAEQPSCKFCGAKFVRTHWRQVYCSPACQKARKDAKLPVPKPCDVCKKIFTPTKGHPQQKHCSRKCNVNSFLDRDNNREKNRERLSQRYKKYRKAILAKMKKEYGLNPEKFRKQKRDWARLNPEKTTNFKFKALTAKVREYEHIIAQQAEAERFASKFPPDWWDDNKRDWRPIGSELLSRDGYMSNEELAERLDKSRLLRCPFCKEGSWGCITRTGPAMNHIAKIRKWVNRPGKAPVRKQGHSHSSNFSLTISLTP